ncbi:cupin domain-containing protein [Burkholderia cenocepacia]|nr:cupin domain-containing protein [Burkholderia sp. Bp9012]RQR69558.1 cupin domain-containing protein [Burkholderia sp. Bp9011]RQR82377.1 cupin domain-containing protein [Burkholderia sp. Bp9010]RQT95295.1 cupin domain-containing protein [Burkholderia cenocepacia]RQZ38229.1 cupin domain-containing protein [Burkholderia sp. Bp9099]
MPVKVGVRLKHSRMLMGLSLKEVATKAGVTEGYLSKIENNVSQPSFASLHRITQALGINMSALFASAEKGDADVYIVRKDERAVLKTGHKRSGNRVTLENLVPSGPEFLLQVSIHVIEPKGGSNEAISHKGQEFGFVLEGRLKLLVDQGSYTLEAGDAFYFDSELGHRYANDASVTTKVLWVNTPPTF